jgi:hypothetical protein
MPADDGSGGTGSAGPRANVYTASSAAQNYFMPSDDSAGGGTPRSNVADVANLGALVAFNAVLLSRQHLM